MEDSGRLSQIESPRRAAEAAQRESEEPYRALSDATFEGVFLHDRGTILEKRYIRKNGAVAWIGLTASLVRDSAGEPKTFISVVEDITPAPQRWP